jgi:hypothetical protein
VFSTHEVRNRRQWGSPVHLGKEMRRKVMSATEPGRRRVRLVRLPGAGRMQSCAGGEMLYTHYTESRPGEVA